LTCLTLSAGLHNFSPTDSGSFFKDKDILIAMTGATAGKLGRVRTSQDLLLNQRVAKIESVEAEPDFIWFALSSERYRERFFGIAGGAAQPNMSGGQIEAVEIPLPPLQAQRKIAHALSAYDELMENNRRRMGLLEEAPRLLYREWFVRLRFPGHENARLKNGIPEGWERRTAYDAVEILSGGTPKTTNPDFWDGEIPFYTPKDAADGIWVTDCERTISEAGLNNCNSRLFPKETVFISARGTVGTLNIAQRPMAMSQSCYALVGKDHVTQSFLFSAMQEAVEALQQQAVGAVFDAIIMDTFKRITLLVPEPRMVRLFDDFARQVFSQLENLMLQNQKLRAARDLLLPRLMSGEIAV
jgi:type I restriction enzyme S subunit